VLVCSCFLQLSESEQRLQTATAGVAQLSAAQSSTASELQDALRKANAEAQRLQAELKSYAAV
jgi:hypothetical protein